MTGILVTCFLMMMTIALPSHGQQTTVLDLSGVWQLNPDLSDNPEAVFDLMRQEAMQQRGGRGGKSGGGRGGYRGGGEGGDPRQQMESMREEFERGRQLLLIAHAGDDLEIQNAVEKTLHITVGETLERETERGTVQERSWQKDGRIIIETRSEKGPTITRTYELDETGQRLVVTVQLDPPRGGDTYEFQLVYDAA